MGTRDIPEQAFATRANQAWEMQEPTHVIDAYAGASPAAQRHLIAALVSQLYEDGTATVRSRLLEKLLRPMSVFSLIHVANGLFAQIKMRNAEWQGFQMRAEDIRGVTADHVAALTEQAQLAGGDAVQGLSLVIATSPALAQTPAARALLSLLKPATGARATIHDNATE